MSGRRNLSGSLRRLHWALIGGVVVLMAAVAAAGHIVAGSAVADGVEISETPMVTPHDASDPSDFVADLAEEESQGTGGVDSPRARDGPESGGSNLEDIGTSAVERTALKQAEEKAAESLDETEEAADDAVEAAAEAVAGAAGAKREAAERATDVLAEAAKDAAWEADRAVRAGETDRALAVADEAVALAEAAEETAKIAAEAAVAEEVAEAIAENPEVHTADAIPVIGDPPCPEVGTEIVPFSSTETARVVAIASVSGEVSAECAVAAFLEID